MSVSPAISGTKKYGGLPGQHSSIVAKLGIHVQKSNPADLAFLDIKWEVCG